MTEYKLPGKDRWLGNYPDIFTFDNGEKVTDKSQWESRRKEMLDKAVNMLYGGLPPKPEVFKFSQLYSYTRKNTYLIETGTKEKTITFDLTVYAPNFEDKFPVILLGDRGFRTCTDEVISMLNERGFAVAIFNRLLIANDAGKREQQIYDIYPNMKFGAIASWAWGYHRCVDALVTLNYIDKDYIAIAGHSRGGKTTLLAGATDERIKFIQDSCSGCCGGGCFRYEQIFDENEPDGERIGMKGKSETLDIITRNFPHWFNNDIREYCGRENELPFDQHFLVASIAPRGVLFCNTFDDAWANPLGSYQTFQAAREAYEFLGAKNMIASNYRYGPHAHRPEEFATFSEFIDSVRMNRPFLKNNADYVVNMPKLYK